MVAKLGLVKLFLYLSPFLRTAFVVNWSQMECGVTLKQAADKAFANGWPTGVNASKYQEWLPEYVVPINRKLHRKILGVDETAKECIWGCKPTSCVLDRNKKTAGCRTDCFFTLRESLDMLYISHVAFSVVFTLIAVVLARCKARSEERRSTHQGEEYTFLQFQAKCDEVARYEYASWGGSYVEDFLEVVLGFAMVACFGIMRPLLAFFALLAAIIEHRLLAYRMTHVTSRPYPTSSQGIEMWQRIISAIVVLSVIVNSGLAVFLLPPFDRWKPKSKVTMFLGYGYAMLFFRFFVQSLFPKRPADVGRIEDFNAEFLAKVSRENVVPELPATEVFTSHGIDIGLEPKMLDGTPSSRGMSLDDTRSLSLLADAY